MKTSIYNIVAKGLKNPYKAMGERPPEDSSVEELGEIVPLPPIGDMHDLISGKYTIVSEGEEDGEGKYLLVRKKKRTNRFPFESDTGKEAHRSFGAEMGKRIGQALSKKEKKGDSFEPGVSGKKKRRRFRIKTLRSPGGSTYFSKVFFYKKEMLIKSIIENIHLTTGIEEHECLAEDLCIYPELQPPVSEYGIQKMLWLYRQSHFARPCECIQYNDDWGWLVMELCGKAVVDIVHEKDLDDLTRYEICKQTAAALKAMHELLCPHMDIKCDNVVRRGDSPSERHQYVLVDFGHAIRIDHHYPITMPPCIYPESDDQVLHIPPLGCGAELQHFLKNALWQRSYNSGTAWSRAPESVPDTISSPFAADIWSLGIMFFVIHAKKWLGSTSCYDDDGTYCADYVDVDYVENSASSNPESLVVLIRQMLQIDYRARPTIIEVLHSPFFQ